MRTHFAALCLALSLVTSLASGCAVDTGATAGAEALTSVRPSFELWQASDGWRFQFVSASDEVLLDSQAYSTRVAALNGVLAVIENGVDAASYQLVDIANGTTLALRAANHATIGDGGVYESHAAAEAARDASIDAVVAYQDWQANRTGSRFDVFTATNGRFYFRLRAGNGGIVLQSQGYATEESALGGTFSVADFGTSAARYDVRQATSGQWYFNLTASNGQVIGTSEMYASRYNAERGRDAIIALLPSVELL